MVQPSALVCLGASPRRRCSGRRSGLVATEVGRSSPIWPTLVTLTTHPSAILRADDDERDRAMDMFVADLTEVAEWLSAR